MLSWEQGENRKTKRHVDLLKLEMRQQIWCLQPGQRGHGRCLVVALVLLVMGRGGGYSPAPQPLLGCDCPGTE